MLNDSSLWQNHVALIAKQVGYKSQKVGSKPLILSCQKFCLSTEPNLLDLANEILAKKWCFGDVIFHHPCNWTNVTFSFDHFDFSTNKILLDTEYWEKRYLLQQQTTKKDVYFMLKAGQVVYFLSLLAQSLTINNSINFWSVII